MAGGRAVPTRVLFFAWGDSIHARRRIGIFTADPAFDVGVVSTYAYGFENADNFYLLGADAVTDQTSGNRSPAMKLLRTIIALPLYMVLRCTEKKASFQEAKRVVEDVFRMRCYVREFKPDVIFLQTLLYPCYLSLLLPRKTPTIITFWNGDVTWWSKWTGIERAFKKQIVTLGARRAGAITVNSVAALDACLTYGASRENVHLIRYPGVNLEAFLPAEDRTTVRRQLSIERAHVVLCPRGLGGYLNSDVIVEAIAAVAARIPEVLFLFLSSIGSEDIWQTHLQRARELGVVHNLALAGQIPWHKMAAYYQAADVMVSMSSNDSLPNCMLEAMGCGVPVVMGNIPPIREWVTDGVNGFLVEPRDASQLAETILEVLEDKSDRVPAFIRYNLALVQRKVDSRKVALAIKDLVRCVVGAGGHDADADRSSDNKNL